jgi:sulfite reductase alpha subunit-like flavoprotein
MDIQSMSIKDMERIIYDILTDNGMSDDDAEKTVKNMSTKDMERYLYDAETES